jgi:hypothetical protein
VAQQTRRTREKKLVVEVQEDAAEVASSITPADITDPLSDGGPVEPTPPEPPQVVVLNRSLEAIYVPIRGDTPRIGPKKSVTVPSTDITEDTRLMEKTGRIFIRNL